MLLIGRAAVQPSWGAPAALGALLQRASGLRGASNLSGGNPSDASQAGPAGGEGSSAPGSAAPAAGGDAPAYAQPKQRDKPPLSQKVRFLDRLVVEVTGGKGGGGASALFGRTGQHPRAAGGPGGRGGDVLFVGTRRLLGLGGTPKHVTGRTGGGGGKQWMDGRNGEPTVVEVPLGTLVWELAELEGPGPAPQLRGRGARAAAARAAADAADGGGYWGAGKARVQPLRPEDRWWPADGAEGEEWGAPEATAAPAAAPAAAAGPTDGSEAAMAGRKRRRLFGAPAGSREAWPAAAAASSGAALDAMDGDGNVGDSESEDEDSAADSDAWDDSSAGTNSSGIGGGGEAQGLRDGELFDAIVSGAVVLSAEQRRQLWLTGRPDGGGDWGAEGRGAAAGGAEGEPEHQRRPTARQRRRRQRREREQERQRRLADAKQRGGEEGGEDEEGEEEEEEEEAEEGEEEEEEDWRDAWARTHAEGGGWDGDDEGGRQLSHPQVRAALEAGARLLGEITEDGQQLLAARGGAGGRGNSTAPSLPYGPASRDRSDGRPGQRRVLLLETRLLADVVLVGLPNVGKSSLVAALTGARAQVGSYAFTTLRPQLGMLRFPDGGALTMADVPGLVEGAHEGRGRGATFLGQIRKARALALVVDLAGGAPGALVAPTPAAQLQVLRSELARFDPALLQLPCLVVANKVDALDPAAASDALAALKAATAAPIVPVSAAREAGLARLAAALRAVAGAPRDGGGDSGFGGGGGGAA